VQAKLIEWVEIAPGVRHFVFEAPQLERLEFVPGNSFPLSDLGCVADITRAYSIASAPGNGNRFELRLNRVDDGAFTPHLFDLSAGDVVNHAAAAGHVHTAPAAAGFVTGGDGNRHRAVSFDVEGCAQAGFAGSSLCCSACGMNRTCCIVKSLKSGRQLAIPLWPTLTQPGPDWEGRGTGRVQAHLDEAIGGRRDIDIYLCGLQPMVDDVRQILKGMDSTASKSATRILTDGAHDFTGAGCGDSGSRRWPGSCWKLMPAPLKDSDYLIIGSVSTMVCRCLLLFVLLIVTSGKALSVLFQA
jgi:CDP-4-dehydro-6-deoxyglucose reductase